jgi:DNA-binding XRE family transcriptional regulator
MRRNKVRQLRESIPLSIAERARRAGLAYQTVTKMERGLPTRKYSEFEGCKSVK